MWPAKYWPAKYWPAKYWPKVGVTVVATVGYIVCDIRLFPVVSYAVGIIYPAVKADRIEIL